MFDHLNSFSSEKYDIDYENQLINSKYIAAEDVVPTIEYNPANCLSTLCINIRSLANNNNFQNLLGVIESMSIIPDVIGITETWLKPDQRGPFINLPNYTFLSSPRQNSRGGGTADS